MCAFFFFTTTSSHGGFPRRGKGMGCRGGKGWKMGLGRWFWESEGDRG